MRPALGDDVTRSTVHDRARNQYCHEVDWPERCLWERRSGELGILRIHVRHVEMEYLPQVPAQTWSRWLALPEHANILPPAQIGWLRYAAIDWHWEKIEIIDPAAVVRFATWGLLLARVYAHVARYTADLAWLTRPLVKFDVEGVMRVGFLPPDVAHAPRETQDQWPLVDERALVHVVATALAALAVEVPADSEIARVLARARAADREARYPTLGDLEAAFLAAGARHIPKQARPRRAGWADVEAGLGFVAIDQLGLAVPAFREAARRDPRCHAASALLARFSVKDPVRPGPLIRSWETARGGGAEREPARDFAGALERYQHVQCASDAEIVEYALARARCRFELGFIDHAVALAREAMVREPASREAHAIETRSLLALRSWADALRAADAWLVHAPEDGVAHHARGKALLGLHRLTESRDAFERACTCAPELMAAMWLRTAVDKALRNVRLATGTPVPMPVDLPPGPVRDALVAGRIDEAIALLGPSQLQGELLSYAGKFEEALRVFAQLEGDAAVAGRARALIDLGRTEEALALLGTVDADADGFVVSVRSGAR